MSGSAGLAAVAILLVLMVAQVRAQKTYQGIGAGNSPCTTWTALRHDHQAVVGEQWILGFLSGVGYASAPSGVDPLKGVEAQDVFVWADKHCQSIRTICSRKPRQLSPSRTRADRHRKCQQSAKCVLPASGGGWTTVNVRKGIEIGSPASGFMTLEQVAKHTAALVVACSRCDRAGRYSLDTLIAKHGPSFGVPDLLRLLSADCPKRQSLSAYDLCGVHCPELSAYFRP